MSRALIVDDKEENLYYLRVLLEGRGFEVESARHGAEALVKARQSQPDVVITDLLMPVMDGYTMLRHWKADERLRKVPFVVYTATYTDPEDEQLAVNLGADAFILKPCEPDDFLDRLLAVQHRAPEAIALPVDTGGDVEVRFREYSETLIRKLEHKTLQLEEANRALQSDIARREQAEAALRRNEELLRQLAETIEDVFWLADPLLQSFFYVSPAYEEIWGRSRELKDVANDWARSIHPGDRRRIDASLTQLSRGMWDELYRIVRPDGAVRWIRSRAFPVQDAHGATYRVAGVSRDVTEYRALEAQLRQSQKMDAIGRLAGGVAHDFNNLLTVILSYTTFALTSLPEESPLRGELREVYGAGERAADLTRQLLAFSRQQMLQPTVLDLGEVLLGMEKMLQRLLGEDVELLMATSSRTHKIHADRSQIEQIVMNLVVNARDAMPRGGVLTIETANVRLEAREVSEQSALDAGMYVVLTVRDTGTGMDAATRERIFEPFFTTKETGKGTGLGLATVFGIVAQSRGHVDVESELGDGTTFRVYLPCTDRTASVFEQAAPSLSILGGTETILLVEDDAYVRATTREILQRRGYKVIDAQNGGEAFLASEKFAGTIDLLLTDVVMPRMTGHELAARIVSTRPDMKTLFVSGYADEAVAPRGVVNTSIAFLQKPITPDVLLRKVRHVLDQG